MIITCEKCTTSYSVADDALGADGRKVKCISCGHVWLQQGIDETGQDDPVEFESLEDGALEDGALEDGALEDGALGGGAPEDGLQKIGPPDAKPPAGRKAAGMVPLAALSILVAGLAGSIYAGRAAIVGSWPPAALLYEEFGIGLHGIDLAEIPGVGAGLEYRNVRSEIVTDAFGATLWVRGEVLNASEIPRPVPTLRVSLADSHGAALESWTFALEVDRLDPGAAAPFETSRRAGTEAAGKIVLGVDAPWSAAATVESELTH